MTIACMRKAHNVYIITWPPALGFATLFLFCIQCLASLPKCFFDQLKPNAGCVTLMT